MGRMTSHIIIMENKSHVPNHQPDIYIYIAIYGYYNSPMNGTKQKPIQNPMVPSGKHTKNYGKIHHFQWENPL
jgi:hypothetical protein